MGDPPDIFVIRNPDGFQLNKDKKLNIISPGPKYLIMTRINSEKNLNDISPFLIKKTIDAVCGEIKECKKLQNGTRLLLTKNLTQAQKLISLTALNSSIQVEVTEHKTLNVTKGIIYSNDLRGVQEEEILNELREQGIMEVRKILKRENENLKETGLIILTFQSMTLPEKVNIGYEKTIVRPYIPLPMRCVNCWKYNHTAKWCRGVKTCQNCGEAYHLLSDNEKCIKPSSCINCTNSKIEQCNHSALDKKCVVFLEQRELQAIKTIEKVDHKTATEIYRERHNNNDLTCAQILRSTTNAPLTSTVTYHQAETTKLSDKLPDPQPKSKIQSNNTTNQIANNHDNDTPEEAETLSPTFTMPPSIKLLPKNTPRHLVRKLKSSRTTKNSKTLQNNNSNKKPRHSPQLSCSDDGMHNADI